mgnify:CR=1 FL=1
MKQSFLINDRIYLRAVEPEDMDVMYEMENDPSMWDISNFTVPYSRYVLRQYIEGSQCDVFADKQLRLMIVTGKVLHLCSILLSATNSLTSRIAQNRKM